LAASKKSNTKERAPKKRVVKKVALSVAKAKKSQPPKTISPDLSSLPAELITREFRDVCLACVLDVLTRHLGLTMPKAQMEIRRYAPSLEELRTKDLSRPFFVRAGESDPCPYCGAVTKWHARLTIYRIESRKSTDAQRRVLLKSLPESGFVVLEERATQQDAFHQWVERISASLDLDDPRWLFEVSRHYLARQEPKTDWDALFAQARSIRRSRLLETGYALDQNRLFLARFLFDELLLVQYLVSRAHRSGGLTLEGRYTLHELFARLRKSGYLRSAGVDVHSPADAFEQLLTHLGGGETAQRFYYVVDRRNLLDRIKALKDLRVPRAKQSRV
jgi:hypothetical protein